MDLVVLCLASGWSGLRRSTSTLGAYRRNHCSVLAGQQACCGVAFPISGPAHGIEGFKCYVALAIVARNIHRIGHILWQQEQQQLAREAKRTK